MSATIRTREQLYELVEEFYDPKLCASFSMKHLPVLYKLLDKLLPTHLERKNIRIVETPEATLEPLVMFERTASDGSRIMYIVVSIHSVALYLNSPIAIDASSNRPLVDPYDPVAVAFFNESFVSAAAANNSGGESDDTNNEEDYDAGEATRRRKKMRSDRTEMIREASGNAMLTNRETALVTNLVRIIVMVTHFVNHILQNVNFVNTAHRRKQDGKPMVDFLS